MKKIVAIFLIATVAGCATYTPMPKPAPMPSCDMKVNGECREQSASEKGGAVVRGHGQEAKDVKP